MRGLYVMLFYEDGITYKIKDIGNGIQTIELDQQSKDKLNQKFIQKVEDLGTCLINGVLVSVEEGTSQIF